MLTRLAQSVPALGESNSVIQWLATGKSNRTFLATMADGQKLIIREGTGDDPILGLDRRAEVQTMSAASEACIGPRLLACALPEGDLAVEFLDNTPPDRLWWSSQEGVDATAELLKRFHGLPGNGKRFDPVRDIQKRLHWARAQGEGPSNALAILSAHQEPTERLARAHAESGLTMIGMCHGDFFRSNALLTSDGLRIIDLEFAGEGDGWYDLACISLVMSKEAQGGLIEAYCGVCDELRWKALARHQYFAAVWDATWVLVQALRDKLAAPESELEKSLGRLDAALEIAR